MKEEKLIDLVLGAFNVSSTPEVRDMVREFIHCDLQWFQENFTEEQEESEGIDEYDELQEFANHSPYDQSICGKSDHFSYHDNCIR